MAHIFHGRVQYPEIPARVTVRAAQNRNLMVLFGIRAKPEQGTMNTLSIIIGVLIAAAVLFTGCSTPSGTGGAGMAITPVPTPPPASPPPPGTIAAALTLATMRADLSEAFEEALAYPLTGDGRELQDTSGSMDEFDASAASFADSAGITRPDHVQEYAEFQAIMMMKESFRSSATAMSDEFRTSGSVSRSAVGELESRYGDLSTELDRFYEDYKSRVPSGASDSRADTTLRIIDMKCDMFRASGDVFGYLLTGDEGRTQNLALHLGDLDKNVEALQGSDMNATLEHEAGPGAMSDLLDAVGTFKTSANALAGAYDREGVVNLTSLESFEASVDAAGGAFDRVIEELAAKT
jgi:hypothetical protein